MPDQLEGATGRPRISPSGPSRPSVEAAERVSIRSRTSFTSQVATCGPPGMFEHSGLCEPSTLMVAPTRMAGFAPWLRTSFSRAWPPPGGLDQSRASPDSRTARVDDRELAVQVVFVVVRGCSQTTIPPVTPDPSRCITTWYGAGNALPRGWKSLAFGSVLSAPFRGGARWRSWDGAARPRTLPGEPCRRAGPTTRVYMLERVVDHHCCSPRPVPLPSLSARDASLIRSDSPPAAGPTAYRSMCSVTAPTHHAQNSPEGQSHFLARFHRIPTWCRMPNRLLLPATVSRGFSNPDRRPRRSFRCLHFRVLVSSDHADQHFQPRLPLAHATCSSRCARGSVRRCEVDCRTPGCRAGHIRPAELGPAGPVSWQAAALRRSRSRSARPGAVHDLTSVVRRRPRSRARGLCPRTAGA